MKVACSQPTYIGSLNYFDLIDQADYFIIYDDVKFEKSSWQQRNYIKSPEGKQLLCIPTSAPSGRMETRIKDVVMLHNTKWQRKHIQAIKQNYAKAPYLNEFLINFGEYYDYRPEKLADWTTKFIQRICDRIGIDTLIAKSSNIGHADKTSDERLLAMVQTVGGDEYITSIGAKGYIDKEQKDGCFAGSDVKLTYQVYEYPEYKQQHGTYIPYLSIIDAMMNVGLDNTLELIRRGRR